MCRCADVDIFIPCPQQVLWLNYLCQYADMNNIIWNILLANFYEYNLFHVFWTGRCADMEIDI